MRGAERFCSSFFIFGIEDVERGHFVESVVLRVKSLVIIVTDIDLLWLTMF